MLQQNRLINSGNRFQDYLEGKSQMSFADFYIHSINYTLVDTSTASSPNHQQSKEAKRPSAKGSKERSKFHTKMLEKNEVTSSNTQLIPYIIDLILFNFYATYIHCLTTRTGPALGQAFLIGVPGFKSWLYFQNQFPTNVHSERQQEMPQVVESLPPT